MQTTTAGHAGAQYRSALTLAGAREEYGMRAHAQHAAVMTGAYGDRDLDVSAAAARLAALRLSVAGANELTAARAARELGLPPFWCIDVAL